MSTQIEPISPPRPRPRDPVETSAPLIHPPADHDGQAHHDDIPTDLPRVSGLMVAVVAGVFVLLLAGLFLIGYFPHEHSLAEADAVVAQNSDKPLVEASIPQREANAGDLVLTGDARALQETLIYPRASGYLKTLLVDIGDHVKAGQLLAEIDTPEIDAQLNQARASLAQSRAGAQHAQADLDFAQTTLKRYEEAAKAGQGAVTQQDLDQKRSAVEQAQSDLASAKANITAQQADVQRLTDMQNFKRVTAPFDGVISARNYDIGALLSPGNTAADAALFRITRADVLRVFVNVPQWAADSIKLGQNARFTVRNFPGKVFEGKVTRSAGAIDPSTRTLRMQIDIPNKTGELQAGMYGQVKMTMHQPAGVKPPLMVPTSAMLFDSDGIKVAVVDDQNIVHLRTVSIGRDFGTELEVVSGLEGDERVITNPGERLSDGTKVDVAKDAGK